MRSPWRVLLIASMAIVVAHLLDGWAWVHLVDGEVYQHDRGRLLRVVGYYPLWVALGIALWLQTRDRRAALLLGGVPGLGGLAAEVLKLLLRRERPGPHDGEYVFRSIAERPFSTSGLALPSSHALVAMSGAFILCKLYPRAWPIWLLLGAGCAVTRVQAHAHFLSDVVVAGVAAWMVTELVWQRAGRGP